MGWGRIRLTMRDHNVQGRTRWTYTEHNEQRKIRMDNVSPIWTKEYQNGLRKDNGLVENNETI